MRSPRAAAWFASVVGMSIAVWWATSLVLGGPSAPRDVGGWFHVVAEMLTAVALFLAGWRVLQDRPRARRMFLVATGMLLYATVNAAGEFARGGNWLMMMVLLAVAAAAVFYGMVVSRDMHQSP